MSLTLSLDHVSFASFQEMDKTAQDTFWQLWITHRDFLLRQCLKWLRGDHFHAEEVLSVVMFKFASQFPSQREKLNSIKAWLSRITYNVCMDFYREKKKEVNYGENLETFLALKSSYLVSSYSPDSLLMNQELWTILSHSIQALPPTLKDPFILRFWHDMSSLKIAQQLGLSLENVYKRIQKAKQILQNHLKPYLSGLSSLPLSLPSLVDPTQFLTISSENSLEKTTSASPYASWEILHRELLTSELEICLSFNITQLMF